MDFRTRVPVIGVGKEGPTVDRLEFCHFSRPILALCANHWNYVNAWVREVTG